MPSYHSKFNDSPHKSIGGTMIIPFNTDFRGPSLPCTEKEDIVDESIEYFRANSFFKNFEIKGDADRLLIYGMLFVQHCLSQLSRKMLRKEGISKLNSVAVDHFSIPGEAGFPLNHVYKQVEDSGSFFTKSCCAITCYSLGKKLQRGWEREYTKKMLQTSSGYPFRKRNL